jgi:phage tail-like protein
MPPFTVNPGRVDPYKTFKFRVVWDGRPVAGISRVGGLVRRTEVVAHREGGDPSVAHVSPGQTSFAPIRLERGLTHDTAFEAWAASVWRAGAPRGAEMGLADFRKDIRIELMNEAGQIAFAWTVFRCWVSEYQALPDLDAGANTVAIETITLQHEGFERDTAVVEPAEPPTGTG